MDAYAVYGTWCYYYVLLYLVKLPVWSVLRCSDLRAWFKRGVISYDAPINKKIVGGKQGLPTYTLHRRTGST